MNGYSCLWKGSYSVLGEKMYFIRVFIKRRQEAKMTASNHFLAASNAVLGI